MYTDEIIIIDKKIENLISDKTTYSFETLKEKVKEILIGTEMFTIEGELDSKAVDLYLKKVITKRNEIKKEEERVKLDDSKETKYILIEAICKKYEFETKEQLIKKIEELETKTTMQLNELLNSFNH